MKVGISGLFLKPAQVGGAEFLLRGLLIGMAQISEVETFLFLPAHITDWVAELEQGDPAYRSLKEHITIISIPIQGNRFVSEAIQIPRYSYELALNGLIYPNYFTPWQWRQPVPTVTLILDLNHRHYPQYFSLRRRLWLNVIHRATLLNADFTATISDFVRQDIEQTYAIKTKHPVVTLPVPILWQRLETVTTPSVQPEQPFVLCVANHYQHKNLRILLQAFQKLPDDLSEVQLVLVGQFPQSLMGVRREQCDDIPALVSQLGLQQRVLVTGHISDGELAWYYHHAAIFAFPSLFEGFGMPAVEALGMGLPTLTTRCTSLPEVTLNLAQYVDDPLDPQEMAEHLTEMLRHRSQFVPSAEAVAQVRAAYEPTTIARRYLKLLSQNP
ncbi:glycosyltransferase family 1 protein [Leptolyngbya sp. FACHB-261]|uniref:glycosyltransferase family 4 protein n=1 Tax=Leptolyngbya sp. FACHB-261 TaxID=2692806 RepID=UPI001687014C|nr:glycosyltransferase family 1 protein [Leptolyngbya sp. FACHB-261]MBD2104413.1 glycosyltransferase family 4 protein [Leptolyngbya sp. FACHB-261]